MTQEAELPQPNLTVTLTYGEWCTVVANVAAGPYREVNQVMGKLIAQLGPQADAQQQEAVLAVAAAASELRN